MIQTLHDCCEPGVATYGPAACNERCRKCPGARLSWSSPDVMLHDSQMSRRRRRVCWREDTGLFGVWKQSVDTF